MGSVFPVTQSSVRNTLTTPSAGHTFEAAALSSVKIDGVGHGLP